MPKQQARQAFLAALLAPALLLLAATAGSAKPERTDAAFLRKLDKKLRPEHALNRLAFGPRPGDIERVRTMGLDKWIEAQLHPEQVPQSDVLAERLKPLATLGLSISAIAEKYPLRTAAGVKQDQGGPALRDILAPADLRKLRSADNPAERAAFFAALDPAERARVLAALPQAMRRALAAAGNPALRAGLLALGQPIATVSADLMEAKLYRAIYSERQLEEVLVDFWFNHFNVYLNKGPERMMVGAYEREAIRPYVLGKFGDMLLATARHPAMLFYLDNWQSVDPKAMVGRSKRPRGLNENYARELMELHTLGVDGGYSQQDVVDVARCFTGWTLREPRRGASYFFAPRLHDRGEKTVLGRHIAAGRGEEDGREVLALLAHHPSTARFVSRKLAQRFVADSPPQALVERMAARFLGSGGDLRAVMKTMLTAPEFFSGGAWRAKLKSPLEFVASAVRSTGAQVTGALALSARLDSLGQPLYRKEEPTGYCDTADEWTNSAGLLARMNFASELAAGKLPGISIDAARIPELTEGLMLGSPNFQRR